MGAGREGGGRDIDGGGIYTRHQTRHMQVEHNTAPEPLGINEEGGGCVEAGVGCGGMDRVQANVHGGDGGHVSRRAHACPSISV